MIMVVLMPLRPGDSWISFGLTPFFSSRDAQLWRMYKHGPCLENKAGAILADEAAVFRHHENAIRASALLHKDAAPHRI